MTESPKFIQRVIKTEAKPEVVILGKSFTLSARFFKWDENDRRNLLPVFPEQPVALAFDERDQEEKRLLYFLKRKASGVYECRITPAEEGIKTYIVSESKELNPPWHIIEIDVLSLEADTYMKNLAKQMGKFMKDQTIAFIRGKTPPNPKDY
ncbi:hypothetical protein HYW46_01940 [Candidatus Daviesbacteria bacterium]|nr:hypothetical protein [Candidatus Daviesbacteria bacterium]